MIDAANPVIGGIRFREPPAASGLKIGGHVVEIEIGVLAAQGLDRRIESVERPAAPRGHRELSEPTIF
jgi:hypothetical protein